MEQIGLWVDEYLEKIDTGTKRQPSEEIKKEDGIKRRYTELITDDY